jgi:TolB-like protein
MEALNQEAALRMQFRMGINLGDVIHDGERLYGDGINIAARLEGLAEAGGICISGKVHEEVKGKVAGAFNDLGDQYLKNISVPVRVFSHSRDTRTNLVRRPENTAHPSVPHRASIAVVPFANVSGEPEQEYFADGVVEEIIVSLTRIRSLFVIARNSSFAYKGRTIDNKKVGLELGVRYVLQGTVRRAGGRIRITAQLIEAATGAHLWAERFDGSAEDVFELQDNVTSSVVAAIAPMLERAEIERSKVKPTESLDAYDYYLRGVENLHLQTLHSTNEALRLFGKATDLDPDYSAAYAAAAFCYSQRKGFGWVTDRQHDISEAAPLARRAVELGNDDALTLSRAGLVLAYVVEDFAAGALFIERARALNSNLAPVWHASGWLNVWIGEPDTAIEHLQWFVRLSPLDYLLHSVRSAIAFAHVFAGRYAEAILSADQALAERPNSHQALRAAALSYAYAGQTEHAHRMVTRLLQVDPAFRVSKLKQLTPLQRSQDIDRYEEGMRKAGLPS